MKQQWPQPRGCQFGQSQYQYICVQPIIILFMKVPSLEYQKRFQHLSSFRYYRYYYYQKTSHYIKARMATVYLKDLYHQRDQAVNAYIIQLLDKVVRPENRLQFQTLVHDKPKDCSYEQISASYEEQVVSPVILNKLLGTDIFTKGPPSTLSRSICKMPGYFAQILDTQEIQKVSMYCREIENVMLRKNEHIILHIQATKNRQLTEKEIDEEFDYSIDSIRELLDKYPGAIIPMNDRILNWSRREFLMHERELFIHKMAPYQLVDLHCYNTYSLREFMNELVSRVPDLPDITFIVGHEHGEDKKLHLQQTLKEFGEVEKYYNDSLAVIRFRSGR